MVQPSILLVSLRRMNHKRSVFDNCLSGGEVVKVGAR